MADWTAIALFLAGALAGAVIAALLVRARAQARIATLETTLTLERQAAQTRAQEWEQHLAGVSQQALRNNNAAFLQLAQETFKILHTQAKGDLEQKEKAVENLVKPIKESLERADQQIRAMEKERREAYGALSKHLETLTLTQQQLQGETRNLVQALRRPEVRGQWGEMTLKRLVELAGMVEYCDFFQQEQRRSEDGASIRPDMIVRMPDGREVVVDVKTPLDAYLSAVECSDDAQRTQHLDHHARKVREHMRMLAGKAYWTQFSKAPDFVVLFIPGDQFLSAALDRDRDLLEDALKQKVILATPTSFVALLRAVAYGWRQQSLAKNAEQIRATGEELYQRLATFSEHLAKLGRTLDTAVGDFNKAAGSFDTKLLPGARKFLEMGITEHRPLEPPQQIEKGARDVVGALPDSIKRNS